MSEIVVATITFSDTRSSEDDRGGALLRKLLGAAGFTLGSHQIVREEPAAMRAAMLAAIAIAEISAVVTTGGTGIAPSDHTLSVLEPLFDKPLLGFGETFRRLSVDEIGPRGMLSNATAGVVGRTIVCALPGSPGAVRLGVDKLLSQVLAHMVALACGETAHGIPQQQAPAEQKA